MQVWDSSPSRWGELPPLAFDHARIIAVATERLRSKLEYTNAAYSLLPESFTLGELQHVYEAVLSRPLDPRNFRKRILELELVVPTGETRRGGAFRPAQLYRFTSRQPTVLRLSI